MGGIYSQNFPVNKAGQQTLNIPDGLPWVTIQNSSGYAVNIYNGMSTDVADRVAWSSPFAYTTMRLPDTAQHQLTIAWTGGSGADQFSIIFSEMSLNISHTLLTPGGTSNVILSADSIGLAKAAQFPANLLSGFLGMALGFDNVGLAKDGTEQTGVTPPAGVSGMRGWLSAIWHLFEQGLAHVTPRKQPQAVTFHDAVIAPETGGTLLVAGLETLTFEVYGSSGSRTLVFEGQGVSGAWYPILGLNLSGTDSATGTTGSGELWQIDVRGLVAFRVNLTAVSGGDVSVKGWAV